MGKNTVKDILTKYFFPTIVGGMTVDSWYQGRFGLNSNFKLKSENKELVSLYSEAQSEVGNSLRLIQESQNRNSVLQAKAHSLSEYNGLVKNKFNEISEIKNQLMTPGLSDVKKEELTQRLDYNNEEFLRLMKEHIKAMSDFTDSVKGSTSSSVNQSNAGSQSKVLEELNKLNSSSVEVKSDSVDSIPDENIVDLQESNILGTLSDMRSAYKEFLGSLSTEELCCLSNLIGFLMVLGGLVSITFILFGDYLINYFKLEERFPKLAKYIQLRQKIQRYTLIFHMFMVYLILIVFIIINAYMFIM